MFRLATLVALLVPLVANGATIKAVKHPHEQHVKQQTARHEEKAVEHVVKVGVLETESVINVAVDMDRPKLTSGCASSGTNMTAGAAILALAAAWFAVVKYFMSKPAPDAAVSNRMPVLDFCKFLLMIPVICQHTTFWFGPKVLQGTMQFVHLHTRTFCFVSGVTAQGLPSERSIKSVVFRLIAPTMLWTLVGFCIFDRELLGKRSAQAQLTYLFQGFLEAPGISWYMYALVCWRVAGWALLSFKPAFRFAVSVLIMMMSGYIIDTPGFIRNAGVYLPIFVAGQLFPMKEVLSRTPQLTPGLFACGIATLALVGCWEYSASGLAFLGEIPFYSWGNIEGPPDGYCDFTSFSTFWLRGLFRNALELSKGLVLILFCCPRSDNVISKLGQYSLYTYLLHPWCQQLVNMGVKYYDWRPHPNMQSSLSFQWACAVMAMCYAFCMNVVLTSVPVRTLFGPVLEPAWLERLFAAESKAVDAPADKKAIKA